MIDEYVAQRAVGGVDLIKLDVEGSEMRALAGAEKLIERDHPDILIEANTLTCGRAGYSYRELLRGLRNHGYALFRLGDGALHPGSDDRPPPDARARGADQLPETVRSDARVARLLERWQGLEQADGTDALRVGTAL